MITAQHKAFKLFLNPLFHSVFALPTWEALRRVLLPVFPADGFSVKLVAKKVLVKGIKRSVRFSGRLVSAHKMKEVNTCFL